MTNAPIAIFCYNRPEHLKRMILSLKNCPEINDSDVFIFQDGPKTNKHVDSLNHSKVREYIQEINIGKSKTVHINKVNKGLGESIRSGINKVFERFDKIIVVEDDLEVSKGFLTYMNDALNLYGNEPKVMHISGYMFPIKTNKETFFMNYVSCWGWGTYKRAWEKLEWDCLYLYKSLFQNHKWSHFTLDGANSNEGQLLANIYGKINTWAIRWQGTIELNDGYCLHPGKSLIQNYGFDGSGDNCPANQSQYFHNELASRINVKKISIVEDLSIIKNLKKFYNKDQNFLEWLMSNQLIQKIADISLREIKRQIRPIDVPDYNLAAIENISRFTPFTIKARNYTIKAWDKTNFLSLWDEVFKKETYKFNPKRDNPVIIDIAAKIGLSALYFSKEFPDGSIHAYEPDPEISNYLSANIKRNEVTNVRVYNAAVWKEDGELTFNHHSGDAGSLPQATASKNSIPVEAISLHNIFNCFKESIDLLKMDIEGAEVETILSYIDGLNRVDHLFIEYHSLTNQPQSLNKLLTAITEAGFRYKIFNTHDTMPNSPFINKWQYGEMDLQVNIVGYRV